MGESGVYLPPLRSIIVRYSPVFKTARVARNIWSIINTIASIWAKIFSYIPSFSWEIFGLVANLDQSCASENIWWIISLSLSIICSSNLASRNRYYYTSDSLWKIWLVESIQSIPLACDLDLINAISAVDIAFIMSSSTSAWLLSPLECFAQIQNGWTLRFCFWGWIMWKSIIKQLLDSVFAWYNELSKPRVCW